MNPTAHRQPRSAALWGLRDLARSEHLLDQHLAEAVHRFGSAALGVVDLPPLTGGSLEPGQVKVTAVLFWAKEVEAAGLPSFVEALAEGVALGRLQLPLTEGADRLMEYYRGRHERFGAPERQAIYGRVFDAPGDAPAFQPLFDRVVTELVNIGRTPLRDPTGAAQARLEEAARELAQHLSTHSAGMAAFAARDITEHVRLALHLLDDADIRMTLGNADPWTTIRLHASSVLGHDLDPTPHLARARAGQRLLAWLADAAGSLDGAGITVQPGDPIIHEAEAYLAAGPVT